MTQQSRILLVVLLFAIGGVSALAFMAQRYGKILQGRAAASQARTVRPSSAAPPRQASWRRQAADRALAEVDSFIRVRRSIRAALQVESGEPVGRQQMTDARAEAIAGIGLHPDVYAKVRKQYHQWREGLLAPSTPISSAFETRKRELAEVDLGEYEKLDS